MTFDFEKAEAIYGMPEKWPIETELGTMYAAVPEGLGAAQEWSKSCMERSEAIALVHGITKADALNAAQIITSIIEPVFTETDAVRLVKKMPKLVILIDAGLGKMFEEMRTAPVKAALEGVADAKK